MLATTERAIVVNSFSKYFSMTGWRVGWVVMPDNLAGSIERLQQNLYICAPHVSQIAALGALDATAELEGHVARYRVNRDMLIDGLASAASTASDAYGAFTCTPPSRTSRATLYRLLTLCRVGSTYRRRDDTGIDFDLVAASVVRFSYAAGTASPACVSSPLAFCGPSFHPDHRSPPCSCRPVARLAGPTAPATSATTAPTSSRSNTPTRHPRRLAWADLATAKPGWKLVTAQANVSLDSGRRRPNLLISSRRERARRELPAGRGSTPPAPPSTLLGRPGS